MTVLKHGTYSGYKRGCRCEACRAAYRVRSAEYMRRWRRGKKVRVPAAEVHRHIDRLRQAGLSTQAIARAAGLSPGTVQALVRERHRTVSPRTADAILGVTTDSRPRGSLVPKDHALRLVEAMVAAGVPLHEIERRIGWRDRGRWQLMRSTTCRKVEVLYMAYARLGVVPADLLEGAHP